MVNEWLTKRFFAPEIPAHGLSRHAPLTAS